MGTADAEQALADWKRRTDSVAAERDGLVRTAHDAGVNINRISQLTGLSRTTIYGILGREGGGQ